MVDFQWNPNDPWTMLSVSDDVSSGNGGGSLQMWRISDLIYRPEHEVLQELQQHARWIISGKTEKPEAKVIKNEILAQSGEVVIKVESTEVETKTNETK